MPTASTTRRRSRALLAPILAGEADFVSGSRTQGSEETKDPVRKLGVRVFALTISVLTGQRITDPSFGLRAMRAEVTGAVLLEQPQYQAAELLIGVLAHGYRVTERPATIHKRQVGKQEGPQRALRPVFRPGDRRHLVARASAPGLGLRGLGGRAAARRRAGGQRERGRVHGGRDVLG